MIKETKVSELAPGAILVSATGGTLDMVSPDGEIVAAIAVPPGRHRASTYTELLPHGFRYEVGEGLVAFLPRSRMSVTGYGDEAYKTDANPDFRPATMSQTEVEMRNLLARMAAASTRQERRMAALEDAAAMRRQAEQAQEVIEKPEPEAKVVE